MAPWPVIDPSTKLNKHNLMSLNTSLFANVLGLWIGLPATREVDNFSMYQMLTVTAINDWTERLPLTIYLLIEIEIYHPRISVLFTMPKEHTSSEKLQTSGV